MFLPLLRRHRQHKQQTVNTVGFLLVTPHEWDPTLQRRKRGHSEERWLLWE